MQTRIAYKL